MTKAKIQKNLASCNSISLCTRAGLRKNKRLKLKLFEWNKDKFTVKTHAAGCSINTIIDFVIYITLFFLGLKTCI